MADSIFVDNGSTPAEIGLPSPPATVTESSACSLKGYGPGCGVRVDRDSLNQQIWALSWVAYRAGMTPSCGTDEESVGWLADAIIQLICDHQIGFSDSDPTATSNATTTTTTTTNADGSITTCTTTTTTGVCPKFHFNTTTGELWVYDEDTNTWSPVGGSGVHQGPCSDYAAGNVPDNVDMWFQEDMNRMVMRQGDVWVAVAN